ncbi:DUF4136 domain-containing protein [Sphingomonas sp. LY29]|uniref:DUF4136 domain-containing protein n=1 Tax=Sphingomonas sp. LY29 TaxID=3095341 RepID=UPI002D76ED37|nr:DUF4136 domain-containing protein [Sphingomonas sp. LY29]WRP25878.1 DUF4136 domain-containing protein [Sphingomonas sp. LY29]
MRLNKFAAAVLLGVSALGLSACATGFPTKVSRYQAMPAPQGQTFYVVPGQGAAQGGGLEFTRYANMVTNAMSAQGYRPATSPESAMMIVQLSYGVDRGREVYVRDPFPSDPFYGGFYGRPYYSRYGYYGRRSPFFYGWEDPFWYGRYGGRVDSYTEYRSQLDLDIRSRATNQSLFEGQAQARSTTDNLGVLVPNLVQAMFTGFPGRSGEVVKITVPPEQQVRR